MAATTSISIPRFLLPRISPVRHHLRPTLTRPRSSPLKRCASSNSSSKAAAKAPKPIVLEKPAKFNPPSHGARLPKKGAMPRHYGGTLSTEEVGAQRKRDYPGMMAPEGTWSHWILSNRSFHLFITMGTLGGLAIFTFVENFKRNSPFADMAPAFADFFSHPIVSCRTMVEIIRLNEAHRSAEVAEKRKRRVEDVGKRSEYRKAHGLDREVGIGGWTAKTDAESLGPALPTGDGTLAATGEPEGRRKWLGIF